MFTNQKGLLSDKYIRYLSQHKNMISPFEEKLNEKGKISYGLSSYGYDAKLANTIHLFTNDYNQSTTIDPKEFRDDSIKTYEVAPGEAFVMPPHSFVLGHTIEHFDLPENVFSICMGKSTYARCGIIVNVTPLEPGWNGHVTLELSNTTPNPVKIYPGEGVCQFLFFENLPCETSYKKRGGKYQGQSGVTHPRIK